MLPKFPCILPSCKERLKTLQDPEAAWICLLEFACRHTVSLSLAFISLVFLNLCITLKRHLWYQCQPPSAAFFCILIVSHMYHSGISISIFWPNSIYPRLVFSTQILSLVLKQFLPMEWFPIVLKINILNAAQPLLSGLARGFFRNNKELTQANVGGKGDYWEDYQEHFKKETGGPCVHVDYHQGK